ADLHERVDEVGLGGEQLGELVDDDEQDRDFFQRRSCGAGLLVVTQRGELACRAQQLLAANQFAVDRVGHPVYQVQFFLEVGDHRAGVRQPVEPGEGRATFEVDEGEVERVGRMGDGQGEHQGAQQFGLT